MLQDSTKKINDPHFYVLKIGEINTVLFASDEFEMLRRGANT